MGAGLVFQDGFGFFKVFIGDTFYFCSEVGGVDELDVWIFVYYLFKRRKVDE